MARNYLKQTGNFFDTKIQPPSKDRKSSYQVWQILGHFCHLIAPVFDYNSVKEPSLTKNVRNIKFEGVSGKLKSKKGFRRQ